MKLERDLAGSEGRETYRSRRRKRSARNLSRTVAETRKRRSCQGEGQACCLSRSTMERCVAAANTPGKSVYELTASIDSAVIDSVAHRGSAAEPRSGPPYSRGRLHRRPDRGLDNPAERPQEKHHVPLLYLRIPKRICKLRCHVPCRSGAECKRREANRRLLRQIPISFGRAGWSVYSLQPTATSPR